MYLMMLKRDAFTYGDTLVHSWSHTQTRALMNGPPTILFPFRSGGATTVCAASLRDHLPIMQAFSWSPLVVTVSALLRRIGRCIIAKGVVRILLLK